MDFLIRLEKLFVVKIFKEGLEGIFFIKVIRNVLVRGIRIMEGLFLQVEINNSRCYCKINFFIVNESSQILE